MSDRLSILEDEVIGADYSLDPLIQIQQLIRARDLIDWRIQSNVKEARMTPRHKRTVIDDVNGTTRHNELLQIASWADIAEALGVSRQVAWRKYAHTIDD
jgi:hypothetical protein